MFVQMWEKLKNLVFDKLTNALVKNNNTLIPLAVIQLLYGPLTGHRLRKRITFIIGLFTKYCMKRPDHKIIFVYLHVLNSNIE